MAFEITILGSSSATPTLERHHSAQYFAFKQRAFMIDCGEGAQTQLMRYGLKSSRIEKFFISHLHPDHCLGLPGLLSSMSLRGRKDPLEIYAPAGLQELLDVQVRYSDVHIGYPLEVIQLPPEPMTLIFEDDQIEVRAFPVQHRVPCWGFRFDEKPPLLSIRKEAVLQDPVPFEAYDVLRTGKDFAGEDGKIYSAAHYTQPGKTPVSYVYVTDTVFLPELAQTVGPADLLYHEATFMDDLSHKALETDHSTARQAAEFALLSGAKKLIIGHFSSRYQDLRPLENEAREVFPETALALEGEGFIVG